MDSGNSSLAENAPNMSLMFMAFSPTFGNMAFQVTPPQAGNVDNAFPTVPYISLEALIYQQMSSNPMISPTMVRGGSNTGQQVMSGQYTMQDQNGINRYQQGYQAQ